MDKRLCVIDLPGLSRPLLQWIPSNTALGRWLAGQRVVGLVPPLPAVTCTVQATLTTGTTPEKHGIIANGLPSFRSIEDQALVDASNFADYRRQISFWEQSNQLLGAPRFWQDESGASRYKTALLFFQNTMPGFAGTPRPAADIVLTPKPDHGPDGKLVSLCWSEPRDLVPRLFNELGPFPLMNYWGPLAGLPCSQWIAQAASRVWRWHAPRLQWVYVPHLDYDLQRFGPDSPQAQKAVADVAAALDPLIQAVLDDGGELLVLSEYAMTTVTHAIPLNRLLADSGLLRTRNVQDGMLVDYEISQAFAMVDHQIAHIYARTPEGVDGARQILASLPGVDCLGRQEQQDLEVNHRRSGDLLAVAPTDAWFDYRWWSRPKQAPAFARQVDIHRKPGYDPMELFWDPAAKGTSQDAALVRGSHGRVKRAEAILAGSTRAIGSGDRLASDVAQVVTELIE